MPKDINMSDLEKEFELELEKGEEEIDERELEKGEEEIDERELEEEFENIEPELEKEGKEEEEPVEKELEEKITDYGDRFYELSQREFESEVEVDDAVNRLLTEMERDFFFKGLWRKIKKGGKWLLKKGLKLAQGLPVLKSVKMITQLARGDLKGLIGSLAKAGLGAAISAVPGGAVALPALKALGFEATEDPERNRAAWHNFSRFSYEAYNNLATNLNERADDPLEASRLATDAFRTALNKTRISAPRKKRYRVIHIRKGEHLIIKRV